MRVFFDTEFIEDGRTIDLISIGMVREDGAEYYAENVDCDITRASPWVKENVFPLLKHGDARRSRTRIANDLIKFAGKEPEFWAYFADYDWVVLCQLYGTMMSLPAGWPKFCLDIQQSAYLRRASLQRPEGGDHNALEDARWNMRVWQQLNKGGLL